MTETKGEPGVFDADLKNVPDDELAEDTMLLSLDDEGEVEGHEDQEPQPVLIDHIREQEDRSNLTKAVQSREFPERSKTFRQYCRWLENVRGGSDLLDLYQEFKTRENQLNPQEYRLLLDLWSKARADYLISRVVPETVGNWTVKNVAEETQNDYKSGILNAIDAGRILDALKSKAQDDTSDQK